MTEETILQAYAVGIVKGWQMRGDVDTTDVSEISSVDLSRALRSYVGLSRHFDGRPKAEQDDLIRRAVEFVF